MAIGIYETNRNVGRFLCSAKGRHGGTRLTIKRGNGEKKKEEEEEEEEEEETGDGRKIVKLEKASNEGEEGRQRRGKGKLGTLSADTDVGTYDPRICSSGKNA